MADPRRNDQPQKEGTLGGRLAWFAALWTGGLVTVAALAYALKALLGEPG